MYPVTDIIILAAGNSSRLGRPKQLLLKDAKTLLNHTIEAAEKSDVRNIYLIIGAYSDIIIESIQSEKVKIIHNQHWEQGMSSSIICGIKGIISGTNLPDAIILLLCDQPFLTKDIINALVNAHQTFGNKIVNCNYGSAIGPPVLFHQSLFEDLLGLTGSEGAKDIVKSKKELVLSISFPNGNIDIDNEDDIVKYL